MGAPLVAAGENGGRIVVEKRQRSQDRVLLTVSDLLRLAKAPGMKVMILVVVFDG